MPNRIIKESICYSEDINKLSQAEEIFFYRLIVNCDDYGRTDARIPLLKARLYPLKDVKSDDINGYLKKLSDTGLILLYENKGTQYTQLVNWEKHQQVRAKRSKYPAPNDNDSNMISDDITCNHIPTYVPENPIRIQSESLSESKSKVKKNVYFNAVKLLDEEYQKLIEQFGESGANSRIENLSLYIQSKGDKYKSHYATILSWERKNNPKQSQSKDKYDDVAL